MDDLRRDLEKHLDGEVRFDTFSRMLYSTDASIYQIEPLGVVIPRHADDVEAAVRVAVSTAFRCCRAAAARRSPARPWGGRSSSTCPTTCTRCWT